MPTDQKTILLVEDDELLATTEAYWLKRAGYFPLIAHSGEKAIDTVQNNRDLIHLILMDIDLGAGIDGTIAAQEILKENDIPLLFLSSHTEKEIVEKTEKITSYGYVVKSPNDVLLLASIKMAFKLHNANKELHAQKKALRLSEEKFAKAFYTSPDAVNINRLSDGVYFEINEGFTRLTGFTADEVIGRSSLPGDLNIWVNKEDRDRLINELGKNGEVINLEAQFRFKDGTERTGLMSARVIEIDGEKYILSISRDISDRKNIERALKINEEKYRLLLDLAPDSFFQGDSRGNLILVNNKAIELTGYSKEELLKMNLKELFPEDIINAKPLRYDLLTRGETIRNERLILRKDGRKIPIEMSSKQMPDGTFESFMRDISDNIIAETKLVESEKRYKQLFNKVDDAILIIGEGKFIDCNGATVRMLRYNNKEELLNTHPSDLSPEIQPDGKLSFEKANEMMAIAMEKGSHRFEWCHKKADGELFDVEVLLTVVDYNKDNKMIHTVWRDITEQKRSEKALRESEERYRELVEKMPDGVYKSSHEGKFLEINSAMVEMLGYANKEELYAIDIKSDLYFQVEDRESAALEEKLEEMAVFRLKKKDGSEIWVEDHGRHVLDDKGKVLYHEGIMRDVTERKLAVDALQESGERFRKIFESNSAAIAIIGVDTTILMVNDAYCQISGYTREEVVGMSWTKQIPPGDLERMKEYNRKRLSNIPGVPSKYDFKFYKKNGEIRDGLLSVSLMPNRKEIITSFIDITDRRDYERQLHRFMDELKIANAAKDKFFSIISHDLKNPFHSLSSALKLMLDDETPLTEDEKHHFLISMLNTSEKAYSLLENLLLWSRSQMDSMEFKPEIIDFYEIAIEHKEMYKNSALQKRISLVSNCTENLFVYADRNMIATVMRNLTSNAIKFTRENGLIEINAVTVANEIEVSVTDNGIGIRESDLDKLFRIDQSFSTRGTNNENGTGLGLVLCKEFIEKNKGKISIESKINEGTRVVFTLPIGK